MYWPLAWISDYKIKISLIKKPLRKSGFFDLSIPYVFCDSQNTITIANFLINTMLKYFEYLEDLYFQDGDGDCAFY